MGIRLLEIIGAVTSGTGLVRPPREKRLKLELSRVDQTNPVPEVTTSTVPRRRIPTMEWVSREAKDEVERTVRKGQECQLYDFQTSKRQIRIHVRQHSCMQYCHCGYQHVSRDQIAEHQKLTRRPGHTRSMCKIYMVPGDQFSALREAMGWSPSMTFGPLLPTTKKMSRVVVDPRPSP